MGILRVICCFRMSRKVAEYEGSVVDRQRGVTGGSGEEKVFWR